MSGLIALLWNCKKATELIERRNSERLSRRKGLELSIHLIGCSFCKLYSKQSQFIARKVKDLYMENSIDFKLHEDFKSKLEIIIDSEIKKG